MIRFFHMFSLLLFVFFFADAQEPLEEPPRDSATALVADSASFLLFRSAHPWTSYRLGREDILRSPGRTAEYLLPLLPGVAEVDQALHFRGARSDAAFYGLEGFNITSPVTNQPLLSLIPDAIDVVDVHTGPYGAEFGRATGGLVLSRMRTGGDSLQFSLDARTDDFVKPGNQLLNTTAQGYRNAILTVSGPLPEGIRFFVAGQHEFMRNNRPMFFEPFRYDSLRVDQFDSRYVGTPDDQQQLLPGPVTFSRNYASDSRNEKNTVQGNLLGEFFDVRLQVLGSYSFEEARQQDWPTVLQSYYRQNRAMIMKKSTSFFGAKATYDLLPFLSTTLSFGLTRRSSALTDPDFGEEWRLFTDSIANAERGYTEFRRRYAGPFSYSTIYAFTFDHPHSPNNRFEKTSDNSDQLSLTAEAHISETWSLLGGAQAEWWTLRRYSISSIQGIMEYLYGIDGTTPRTFLSDLERRVSLMRTYTGGVSNFGYDVDGNETDGGFDKPRTPAFSSAFLQSSWRSPEYEVTIGLRHER
ncbi:MAG: hypothetical protein HYW57_09550 [Ignavibacteriales bacterium]|nr:hypothetical protein [Ignavibacteriales bacterium]